MYNRTAKIDNPVSFDFPFTPYEIQNNFMKCLYSVIENKEIGIFESPTGTGKTLSLICGSLKWLIDHNRGVKQELYSKIEGLKQSIQREEQTISTADWIQCQYEVLKQKQDLSSFLNILEKIENHEKDMGQLKTRTNKKTKTIRLLKTANNDELGQECNSDEDFCIQEEISEEENVDDNKFEDEETEIPETQIFFCSRTHSQLAQVLNEIKNTVYCKSIRVVSLASRQNYCINPLINKLAYNLINERCLDMQKNVRKQDNKADKSKCTNEGKCKFYNKEGINILKNESLAEVLDIEELVTAAKAQKSCPYYSSRLAAKSATIVLLPYNMLLHKRTRIQSGLSLKNNIVIIDEAHNLVETVSNIYSAELTSEFLQRALNALNDYKAKYLVRFSANTLLIINQLLFITNRIIKLLNNKNHSLTTRVLNVNEMMTLGEFYNIKINEILDFCCKTRFAQKIDGFAKNNYLKLQTATAVSPKQSYLKTLIDRKSNVNTSAISELENKPNLIATEPGGSVINPLLSFLECLLENAKSGRIIIKYSADCNPKSKTTIKYLLVNPSCYFEEIIKECRSVIIAGGTMQPTVEFKNQLFPNYHNVVKEHFFGHVVSKHSVLPMAVSRGPTNLSFLFNYANRCNKNMLSELAMTLRNVCSIVPAGVVCFFGSYDYLEIVYKFLDERGELNVIKNTKQIFKESKDSSTVDKMLKDYSKAAKQNFVCGSNKQNGALLLSVVGGKLSEGLNFSDDLGRCVIIVGLPYPSKENPELLEKMSHLNKTINSSAGNEYYENICMKAVNQCIGRAIRHINDYASVLLVDERYSQEKVFKKLSPWIGGSLKTACTYGMTHNALANFFKEKKNKII